MRTRQREATLPPRQASALSMVLHSLRRTWRACCRRCTCASRRCSSVQPRTACSCCCTSCSTPGASHHVLGMPRSRMRLHSRSVSFSAWELCLWYLCTSFQLLCVHGLMDPGCPGFAPGFPRLPPGSGCNSAADALPSGTAGRRRGRSWRSCRRSCRRWRATCRWWWPSWRVPRAPPRRRSAAAVPCRPCRRTCCKPACWKPRPRSCWQTVVVSPPRLIISAHPPYTAVQMLQLGVCEAAALTAGRRHFDFLVQCLHSSAAVLSSFIFHDPARCLR